jgi:hypothetical protein
MFEGLSYTMLEDSGCKIALDNLSIDRKKISYRNCKEWYQRNYIKNLLLQW